MLLAIDVGNTNIVFGIYDKDKLVGKFRITTESQRTADEIGLLMVQFFQNFDFRPEDVSDIILCSVAPYVMYSLHHALRKYFDKTPVIVGETCEIPLKNLCDEPLGVDRAVTGIGAMKNYGKPLIVFDFGTATTADCFDSDGSYLGGVICPGIKISMEALFSRAAKLPHIELRSVKSSIGRNTVDQMAAGAIYGYVGSCEHIIRNMKKEMGGGDIPVAATGGLATLVSEHTAMVNHLDSNLTLKGLYEIFKMI